MTRILLIEDQAAMRRNLSLMLKMEGFEVLAAENGRSGLELAQREKPDLILCDVMMPELDGYGVLTNLRADPATATIPFIFLTARSDKPDLRRGMNLGADDYLTKPAQRAEVLAAITARLARKQAETAAAGSQRGFHPDFSSPDPLRLALGLTPREAEVLLWTAQGKTNVEIGTILGMSDLTVKQHLGHVFEKLGVEGRNAATLRALEILAQPPGFKPG
jgi:DNA-binding NarL/FixJ family response regulator